MKYYKYLDINTKDIAQEIKNYLLENPHLIEQGQGSWRLATDWLLENFPHIKDIFEWDIEFAGIFVSHKSEGSVHIDAVEKPVRVNFPIMNCENTETKYFEKTKIIEKGKQTNGLSYNAVDTTNLKEVDSFVLDRPVAMRVLEPHQVHVYHNNYPRVSCTIQFKQDLEHLLEN